MTESNRGPGNEIRAGLVLYGGISLAIYICGVALEFLRAIRASDKNNFEKNAYRQIVEKTHNRLTVDIISGASAGGINGVMLAKALCNRNTTASFSSLRDFWIENGDFSLLLRPGRPEMAGLLDEEFFEEAGLKAFDKMDSETDKSEVIPDEVEILDLFVAATDLNGRILSDEQLVQNKLNQHIQTKDHRRKFHLKHRHYDTGVFSKENNDILTKICRATAAFPVAFRPLKLEKGDKFTKKLTSPVDTDAIYLSDGGVLNNRPFSDTIATIFKRKAVGHVDRMLFYVDPDPETFSRAAKDTGEPDFWDVVARSLSGIPGYQSISGDMLNIKERNVRIDFIKRVMEDAEAIIQKQEYYPKTDKKYRQSLNDQPIFMMYQELKLEQLYQYMQDKLSAGMGLEESGIEIREKVAAAFKNAMYKVSKSHKDDKGKFSPDEDKLKAFLGAFDSPYRSRRFFRMIEMVEAAHQYYAIDNRKQQGFLEEFWRLFNRINRTEWQTWDINEGIFKGTLIELKKVIASLSKEQLESELISLLENMKPRLKEIYDGLTAEGVALAETIDESFNSSPRFSRIYEQFEFRDMYFYPIEVLSGLGERDKIDVVRISPKDSTEITDDSQKKLAGDALGHFGGFLDAKWRKNDIMWGRLDAAELIVKTLYPKEKREDAAYLAEYNATYKKYIDSVLTEILNDELPQAVKSKKGFRKYLVQDYHVGEEGIGDIDAGKTANLGVSALQSIIGLLKYDSGLKRTNASLKFVDKLLLKPLGIIYPPLSLFVQSAFGRNNLMKKIVLTFWLILGFSSLIIFALFVVGKYLNIGWLGVSWQLAGIALFLLVLTLFVFYLNEFIKETRKTWLKALRLAMFGISALGIFLVVKFLWAKLAGIAWASIWGQLANLAKIDWLTDSGWALLGLILTAVGLIYWRFLDRWLTHLVTFLHRRLADRRRKKIASPKKQTV